MQVKTFLFVFFSLVLVLQAVKAKQRGHNSNGVHCSCYYNQLKRGCSITVGPEVDGYKCICNKVEFGFGACSGTPVKCDEDEVCKAGCNSAECCKQGGGDCTGY